AASPAPHCRTIVCLYQKAFTRGRGDIHIRHPLVKRPGAGPGRLASAPTAQSDLTEWLVTTTATTKHAADFLVAHDPGPGASRTVLRAGSSGVVRLRQERP